MALLGYFVDFYNTPARARARELYFIFRRRVDYSLGRMLAEALFPRPALAYSSSTREKDRGRKGERVRELKRPAAFFAPYLSFL